MLAPQVTTKKRETLILNVDGCIAACFVDLLRSCGAFTQEEVNFAMSTPFLLLACVSSRVIAVDTLDACAGQIYGSNMFYLR